MLGNKGIEGVSEKEMPALIDASLNEIKGSLLSLKRWVRTGVWCIIALNIAILILLVFFKFVG